MSPAFRRTRRNVLRLRPLDVNLGIAEQGVERAGCEALFAALKNGGKASIVSPLTALYPLVVIMMVPFLLHETITRLQVVGVICALIAVVLLSA